MQTLNSQDIETFRDQGFLIIRKLFDADDIALLCHAFDYTLTLAARPDLPEDILRGRGDVHIHLQAPDGATGPAVRYIRKVQWPALLHPAFEAIRTSPIFAQLLAPLLSTSLKQYINQINFKIPGGDIAFPWHQDIRPTPAFTDQIDNYVQTIIAIDQATAANGCLHIVPGSHKLGNLKTTRYATGQIEQHVDVTTAVPCEADPGYVILFTSYTVHGSTPNTTDQPRRSYINGFVRAKSCTVGKWAFLNGQPVPITSDRDYHAFRAKSSE